MTRLFNLLEIVKVYLKCWSSFCLFENRCMLNLCFPISISILYSVQKKTQSPHTPPHWYRYYITSGVSKPIRVNWNKPDIHREEDDIFSISNISFGNLSVSHTCHRKGRIHSYTDIYDSISIFIHIPYMTFIW